MGGLDASGAYTHQAQARHDVAMMLRFCAHQFACSGYMLTGQGPTWVSAMRGAFGYAQTALGQPHQIVVTADGWSVWFQIRGHHGFGPLFVPQLDAAVGQTLLGFDSWVVQQTLLGPPSSGAYAPAPHSQPSHVIERQVVVTRCKFCQAMTPVDGPSCSGCGAKKFS